MRRSFEKNVLPTQEQSLMLKACLHPSSSVAGRAFHEWLEVQDLDDLDQGSFRLSPLLWKRAIELSWDLGEEDGRLRGLYRFHWSKHILLERGVKPVIQRIHDEGIRSILLKGSALSRLVYKDPVFRPSSDVDLLVSRQEVARAIEVLSKLGWTTLQTNLSNALDTLHGIGFTSPAGLDLDLHWHILASHSRDTTTEAFLEGTISLEGFDRKLETLSLEAHLVHACGHGAVYSPWPQIRWLADVDRIVAAAGGHLSWEKVLHLARTSETSLSVFRSLHWLHENVETPVPAEVLEEMAGMQSSLSERALCFVTSLKTPEEKKFRHRLPEEFLHFVRKRPFSFSRSWFSEMRRYLRATNNFLLSPRELFQNWARIGLIKFRNIQYGYLPLWLSGSPNWRFNRDSISRRKNSETFGFHLLECDPEKRLLRWSEPAAVLRLGILNEDVVLEIETANCRSDLRSDEIQFLINRTPLPLDFVSINEHGTISVRLCSPYRPNAHEIWLHLKVEPWKEAAGDPRSLGIPVYAIRLVKIAS